MLTKIISGGQTGADQAALDAAIELLIPHGGWIPYIRELMGVEYLHQTATSGPVVRPSVMLPYQCRGKSSRQVGRGRYGVVAGHGGAHGAEPE